jgi:hypothetical protein
MYVGVGVMKDYNLTLRNLLVSHTLVLELEHLKIETRLITDFDLTSFRTVARRK